MHDVDEGLGVEVLPLLAFGKNRHDVLSEWVVMGFDEMMFRI